MALSVRAEARTDHHRRDIERGRKIAFAGAKLQLGLLIGAATLTAGVALFGSSGLERIGLGIAAVVVTIALLSWRWQKQRIQRKFDRVAAKASAASDRSA